MARLKMLGSRVQLARPAIVSRYRPLSEAERSRQRDAEQPWRQWYKTAAWQKLRKQALWRDAVDITGQFNLLPTFELFPGHPMMWPQCQQTGLILLGKHPAEDSPVADHIKPHRGDRDLFFDLQNLQTLSKAYHDKEKQKQERAGLY